MKRAPRPGSARWIRLRDPALAERFAELVPEMRGITLAAIIGAQLPAMSESLLEARAALKILVREREE